MTRNSHIMNELHHNLTTNGLSRISRNLPHDNNNFNNLMLDPFLPFLRFSGSLLIALSTFLFSLFTDPASAAPNTWTTLATTPATVAQGGRLVYPGSGDTIYAFRGNTTTTFWGYSIANNIWAALAAAPATVQSGGSLVYPGSGDTIYAFGGNLTTSFWAYSVKNNTWTTMAAAPATVESGGSLVYPGSGDTIYAFRGNTTTTFWAYSITNDTWTTMAVAPATASSGGALVYPGSGDTVYALGGNTTTNFWGYTVPFYSGPNWYVNDVSTAGDSFTSRTGDTTGDGSSGRPFLTITKALTKAKAGDTIYIDAGAYTETVVISTSNLWLIGADSRTTVIDPPGSNATAGLYGILAQNVTGLVLKNLGVTGAYTGVRFSNVDFSTVTGDSFGSNGRHGIELVSGSDTNTITQCDLSRNVVGSGFGIEFNASTFNTISNSILNSNGQYGVYTQSSAHNNTVSGNTVNSNSSYGMFLLNSSRLTVKNNTVNGGASQGIRLNNGSNCVFTGNTANSNQYGIVIAGPSAIVTNNVMSLNSIFGLWVINGSNLYAAQNTITDNTEYQISFDPLGPSNSIVEKNNFKASSTNPDSIVYNRSDTVQTLTRNWWGTTDETIISSRIFDTASTKKITFKPYRHAQVDTAAGADTTAPAAPGAFRVTGTSDSGQITLEWTAPVLDEETNGGSVGYAGFKIYRLTNTADTTHWANALHFTSSSATDTQLVDTVSIAAGNTYYYRITSRDAAAFVNEGFFADTVTAVPYFGPDWYVNDTYTGADSFTYAGGSDTAYGNGSSSRPFRSLPMAMRVATTGDTIFIDAGMYDSIVTIVAGSETACVNIDKDSITLVGKDSGATVIDPPGANSVSGLYGIYATGRTNLFIRNLGVTGAYRGIYFDNTDLSTISGDSVCSNGLNGIYLNNGSDTNTVSATTASYNSQTGLYVSTSDFNTLVDCLAQSNSGNGNIRLFSSKQSKVRRCDASGGNVYGLWLDSANNNTVDSSIFNSNSQYGIFFNSGSTNTVYGNTCNSNSQVGIYSSGGANNIMSGNVVKSNSQDGLRITSASGNIARFNNISNNTISGVDLRGGADSNIVTLNDISGNDTGVMIQSTATGNLVSKNNITGNNKSSVTNQSGIAQAGLSRNWFGSTDTVTIKNKFVDTADAFTPFRLGAVDTTPGADTTAPKSPDTVAVTSSDTSLIVSWNAVTTNDEGAGGGPSLSAYAIYRSEVKDTSSWLSVAVTTATQFEDTDVAPGRVYSYRVTAYDTSTPFKNESYFSDSQPGDSAPFTSTVNWYVNDTSTTGDSYTYTAGSDTSGNGTPQKPFLSLSKAMALATVGDTIWIDAGLYDSYVTDATASETYGINIDKDSITLIGKDSGSTVIDPPGPAGPNNRFGINASGRTGLLIKNIGVTGVYVGIRFNDVDRSTITMDSAVSCGDAGIFVTNGSDTNTISKSVAVSNGGPGIRVLASSNNTVSGNTVKSNGYGIYVDGGANGNAVNNNTVTSTGIYGIHIESSSNNKVTGNAISGSVYGIDVYSSSNTTITGNSSRSSGLYGIKMNLCSDNTIAQNDLQLNTEYQIYITGVSSSDTVQKNNIIPSSGNPDSAVFNGSTAPTSKFSFTRNWFGSTDTDRIRKMIYQASNGDSVIWQPFRLGQVDTTAGADTTAPKAPDTVAAAPSDTSLIVTWQAVTANEEGVAGGASLSGYRVYRSGIKDTSSWRQVAQTANTVVNWQDTDVAPGRIYFYRVTAFDTATPSANESFFSDSQPSDSAPFTSTMNWYVNDGSTTGDSWTTAAGSDVTGLGTIGKPFASIPRAMQVATAGDTIYIDAGLYDSYVVISATETAGVNIDKDSITLIGKDSGATVIDPPGAKTLSGLYGIYANTRINLFIRDIGVTGAYNGIHFYNVDYSTIDGDSASSCGNDGIRMGNGSDTNTVKNSAAQSNTNNGIDVLASSFNNTLTNNTLTSNAYGIILNNGSNGSTVTNNTLTSNSTGIQLVNGTGGATITNNTIRSGSTGIYLTGGSNNTITNNAITSNSSTGLFLTSSSNNNTVTNNTLSSNGYYGINLTSSSNNTVSLNDLRLNTSYQIFITGTSSSDTVQKNNIVTSSTNPDSGVYNWTGNTYDFARNWWNTVDTVAIGRKMFDTGYVNRIGYIPFRLGEVDTTAGADTTAPKAPDTVAAAGNDTSVTVTWQATSSLEESNGGAVGLSGYRIYRSAVKDTSSWIKVAQVGSAVDGWQDTDLAPGQKFYYRVTALDTPALANESFFSDSQPGDSASFASRVNWYVNDGSTAGDSWATATGSDLSGQGTISSPFASIPMAMRMATAGDTIFIDAGTFDSYVVVNGTDTAGVNIDKDSITLVGKDSSATVIDPPGPNTQANLYGIYADTQTGLWIKNLGVTGAYDGIHLENVDLSNLTGDSASANGNSGVSLSGGSDTNTLAQLTTNFNSGNGVYIASSSNDTLSNSLSRNNGVAGFSLTTTTRSTLINNTSHNNDDGFVLQNNSDFNTLTGNTSDTNTSMGFSLFTNCVSNTLTNNTAGNNAAFGFRLNSSCNNNTVANNTSRNNTSHGFFVDGVSSGNTLTGNTSEKNTAIGFWFQSSGSNILKDNISRNNTSQGVRLNLASNNNLLKNNLIQNNASHGIHLDASPVGNVITQNTIDSNLLYQVYINGASSSDTVVKNNIRTSPTNPDSGAYNSTGKTFDFKRNYWNSTDSGRISKMIFDTATPSRIQFQPYRLGEVDTTAGADTTAPKAPDTVAATGNDTSIIVEWTAVTALEEPANGGAVGLEGYRVFRSAVKDTSSWIMVWKPTGIRYQDTDVAPGRVYYYRVVAYDTATLDNASFFSDSQPSDSASFTSRVNWYVNDGSTVGDSWATATGSDITGQGTISSPFASIPMAMRMATAGDTIYIDAGLYDSYVTAATATETYGVNIDKDSITLIGKDSGATVINPPGANGLSGLYGIYADTQSGLLIKNIGVTGAFDGIYFHNVDNSTIESDSAASCGNNGISLSVNSDSNTISNSSAGLNTSIGIVLGTSSNNNTVTNNTASSNLAYGIVLSSSSNNTLTNNTARLNSNDGINLTTSSNNNTLTNNTASSNFSVGIYLLSNSSNNTLTNNTANSNSIYGILLSSSSNNTVTNNTVSSNSVDGINVSSSSSNTIIQNDVRNNTQYQVYISGTSSSDTVQMNNLVPSGTNPDSGVYNGSTVTTNKFTLTRNWWNSTDTERIKKMIFQESNGDSVIWQPFRLGQVDTTAGADTTAPKAPDTVAVVSANTDTSIILEWTSVTANEEGVAGGAGLEGYRIFRSAIPDTSSWIMIGKIVGAGIRFQDTSASVGTTYYYRVTAYDTATLDNQSFFSDSQPSMMRVFADTGAVTVYVSSFGDSTAPDAGDTTKAYRNINEALAALNPTSGWDTIVVFAKPGGDSYYQQLDLRGDTGLTLISKKAFSGADAVFDTWAKIAYDTGTIIRAWTNTRLEGLFIDGIDSSRTSIGTDPPLANVNEHNAVFLASSCSSAVIRSVDIRNVHFGVVGDSAHLTRVLNNHISDLVRDGIHFDNGSQDNVIAENTIERQSHSGRHGHGIKLKTSAARNTVRDNIVRNSNMAMEFVSTGGSNRIYHNQIYNSDTGVWLSGAGADSFVANNVINMSSTLMDMGSSPNFDARRNWWGFRDMNVILSKTINDGSVKLFPARTSPVDTFMVAADTAAPGTPDTFALNGVSGSGNQVLVTWDTPDFNEDGKSPADLTEYRVYRLTVPDTTDWRNAFLASVGAGVVSYTDFTVVAGTTYYYRLSASETLAGGFFNESPFADTKTVTPAVDTNIPNVWYVNDTSLTGDSFSTGAGSDTQSGLARATPFRTIQKALTLVSQGDTVLIDAGLYAETVVIDTNAVALIGKDSVATVIDPPGDSSVTTLYGIYATGRTGLLIKTMGVTGAFEGIYFNNVDLSSIFGDSACSNGSHGIYLLNGSDSNTVSGNTAHFNQWGIYLSLNSNSNTVTGNAAGSNWNKGFGLWTTTNNIVSGNTSSSNADVGIYLELSSNNTVTGNTSTSNADGGIGLVSSSNNTVSGNTANSNSAEGIQLELSSNNTIVQNDVRNNAQYQVYIDGASSSDTVQKNNIVPSTTNPDSAVYNSSTSATNKFTFTRNWWGTTDETRIKKMIYQASNGDSVLFSPYRLGLIDTAPTADSVPPLPPQNIAVDTITPNVLKLTWSNPTLDEDSASPRTGFGAVRIYRLAGSPDTTHWANALYATLTGGQTTFTDTNALDTVTYYYRLTAEDTATLVNASFFSDTFSKATVFANGDTLFLVSGNHQVIANGQTCTLVVDVKDGPLGQLIPFANVSFEVSYDSGVPTALTAGRANSDGRLTYTTALSSGDGLYMITASVRSGPADDVIFAIYTNKRRVLANKWTMFAPFKHPDTVTATATALGKLSYGGAALSYEYDPALSPVAPFNRYRSISGQAAPNDASPNIFSEYKLGRGYWFKTMEATGLGLYDAGAYAPIAAADTFKVRLAVAGAHMIGNPFPHFIDWLDDVFVTLDTAPDMLLSLRSFTPGVPAIDTGLQWRSQVADQYENPWAAGDTTVQLKPWVGYWVKVNAPCTMVFIPNKRMPQTGRVRQASPIYTPPSQGGAGEGDVSNWRLRLMAYSGVPEIRDEYAYLGVAPAAVDGEDMNDLWKAPGMIGDLQVMVGEANAGNEQFAMKSYATSIAAPVKTASVWPVVVSGATGSVTLKWDASGLPSDYGAYLLGAPSGPVDLRASSSLVLESKIENLKSKISLTLAVGMPGHLAAFLAAPLSADQTFAYPNPGPDAAGRVTFKYNLQAAGEVTLKIFDVGGRLVGEMKETGAPGSNTSLQWDGTNRTGQKVGSGVYIYILEAAGNKLVDKLAIVR